MRLAKALKLKKSLVGEIAALKTQIQNKNSFLVGSNVVEKFDNYKTLDLLNKKVDELITLKLRINEANIGIQEKIFTLSELKSQIQFWRGLNVREGVQESYGTTDRTYLAQIDEVKRDEMVKNIQINIDNIQEEIDVYNYTMSI